MVEQGGSRSCIRYLVHTRQVLYNWLKLQRIYQETTHFCSFIVVCRLMFATFFVVYKIPKHIQRLRTSIALFTHKPC